MSYARFGRFKLTSSRALLILALPTACAVGVTPPEDTGNMTDPVDTAGTSAGGTLGTSGSGTVLPKAGTTSSSAGSAVVSPFGGTASTAGTGSGGQSGAGAGGSSHGGSAGAGGSGKAGSSAGGASAGSSSGGTGGAAGICACPTKKTWADNSNIVFATGDCFDVAGAVYVYTGTKAQTWANKDCNPAMQLAWCSDVGADYKFTLCK